MKGLQHSMSTTYIGKHRKTTTSNKARIITAGLAATAVAGLTTSAASADPAPATVQDINKVLTANGLDPITQASVEKIQSTITAQVPTEINAAIPDFSNLVAQPVEEIKQDLPAAPSSSQRDTIVQSALSQMGKPYVYGATGPSAFDCSGLVQWAYSAAGVSLPRTAAAQASTGVQVDQSSLRPGDVVGYAGGGHIGIYIGDGQVVHAPTEGEVVKISNINMMPIWRMASIVA